MRGVRKFEALDARTEASQAYCTFKVFHARLYIAETQFPVTGRVAPGPVNCIVFVAFVFVSVVSDGVYIAFLRENHPYPLNPGKVRPTWKNVTYIYPPPSAKLIVSAVCDNHVNIRFPPMQNLVKHVFGSWWWGVKKCTLGWARLPFSSHTPTK